MDGFGALLLERLLPCLLAHSEFTGGAIEPLKRFGIFTATQTVGPGGFVACFPDGLAQFPYNRPTGCTVVWLFASMGDAMSWIVVVGAVADSAEVDLDRPDALPAFDTTWGAHGPLELEFSNFSLSINKNTCCCCSFTFSLVYLCNNILTRSFRRCIAAWKYPNIMWKVCMIKGNHAWNLGWKVEKSLVPRFYSFSTGLTITNINATKNHLKTGWLNGSFDN